LTNACRRLRFEFAKNHNSAEEFVKIAKLTLLCYNDRRPVANTHDFPVLRGHRGENDLSDHALAVEDDQSGMAMISTLLRRLGSRLRGLVRRGYGGAGKGRSHPDHLPRPPPAAKTASDLKEIRADEELKGVLVIAVTAMDLRHHPRCQEADSTASSPLAAPRAFRQPDPPHPEWEPVWDAIQSEPPA
jgi:hypothetical protein